MTNGREGGPRETASLTRRVAPASRSLIDAPSENATRDESDHMCANERGAKATITHSGFVVVFLCQWLSRRSPDWACLVRAFSRLSEMRHGRDFRRTVRAPCTSERPSALARQPKPSRAPPGRPELLRLPRA